MYYNFQYNKIKTGILGLDKLLYNGLVIPKGNNIMLLIRGDDDTEKTAFSLQLVQGLASSMSTDSDQRQIHYYSNYLDDDYLSDLELDMIIASSIQKLTSLSLQKNINPQIRNYAHNMIQKRTESASLVKRGHSTSNVTIKTYKYPLPHHAT